MENKIKEQIDQVGNIVVYRVFGEQVRKEFNNFTNFGQHYQFTFIPENEFWIDDKTEANEIEFLIQHLLIEYKLMKASWPYNLALNEANKYEQKYRKLVSTLNESTSDRQKFQTFVKIHIKLIKTLAENVKVWLVDGELIRDIFDLNFSDGGHDLIYPYIPKNEIWIDNTTNEEEIKHILLHESHERMLLKSGMKYIEAHKLATREEYKSRNA